MITIRFSHFSAKRMLGFALFAVTFVSAQQTTGDVTKEADAVPGTTTTGGSIRVIDNRGTIKYLQVKNGLTLLSNTTSDITTTTWQLGGTLTDDTFIDVDGNVFGFNGIDLVSTETPSTDATTQSDAGTGTGYTILVRDEATGAVKKLLVDDLQVIESGQELFTVTDVLVEDYTLTGNPPLPTFEQVYVYRNGAKLIANVDYTISGSTVTLVPGGAAPNDWALFVGDRIEVHFIAN